MIYAIGAFDGFHTGHCELLKTARSMAEAKNSRWGVLTFDRNPQQLLSKDNFKQLFTDSERDFYAKLVNIPKLVKIPFTKELAGLAPDEFMQFVKEKYGADGIVVGEDFRFGAGRSGDTSFIKDYCAENNMAFSFVKTLEFNGSSVSSTRIRKLVCEGKIKEADELLGVPYYLSGEVVTGGQRGRLIGFPTANLLPENGKVYPKNGS
ncbi:MAG: riboflavin kinase, partial [Synergistaceae bacterium]|nr:riboflavin kinase [Synergistaceae bacterium]